MTNLALGILHASGYYFISLLLFVDPLNGDDTNTGLTPSDPLRTLAAAVALPLWSGDVICLKGGSVFDEPLDLSAFHHVTVRQYGPGAKPIIQGTDMATINAQQRRPPLS